MERKLSVLRLAHTVPSTQSQVQGFRDLIIVVLFMKRDFHFSSQCDACMRVKVFIFTPEFRILAEVCHILVRRPPDKNA